MAPIPDVLAQQFRRESGLALVGAAPQVQAQFYATLERRIQQPAVLAICARAGEIFPA